MKLKMSKSQWEEIGKKAGWMKTAREMAKCHMCGKLAVTNDDGNDLCDNPKCSNYMKVVNQSGGRFTL